MKHSIWLQTWLNLEEAGLERKVERSEGGGGPSRHVRGLYILTQDDLLTRRDFPDPIAMGGYPIDIHFPDGVNTHTSHLGPDSAYAVPLRSILVAEPTNLLAAGHWSVLDPVDAGWADTQQDGSHLDWSSGQEIEILEKSVIP